MCILCKSVFIVLIFSIILSAKCYLVEIWYFTFKIVIQTHTFNINYSGFTIFVYYKRMYFTS